MMCRLLAVLALLGFGLAICGCGGGKKVEMPTSTMAAPPKPNTKGTAD
jgi:hypothetical protein